MNNVSTSTVESVLKATDKIGTLRSYVGQFGISDEKAQEIVTALEGALFSGGIEKARERAEEIYDDLMNEDSEVDEDEDEDEGDDEGETNGLSLEDHERRIKALEAIAQRVGY